MKNVNLKTIDDSIKFRLRKELTILLFLFEEFNKEQEKHKNKKKLNF